MQLLKKLREMTGAGMMDCRKALEESDGDLEKAVGLLREWGVARAARRAGRETANGVVEAYVHRTTSDYPPQVGAMIELNCESDFVAKGQDFRSLARELALHVAGAAPRWLSPDDVPAEIVAERREHYRRETDHDGNQAHAIEPVVERQMKEFFAETCLLEQSWVKDPGRTVKELIAETGSKVQENITVRRFTRFSIKEG